MLSDVTASVSVTNWIFLGLGASSRESLFCQLEVLPTNMKNIFVGGARPMTQLAALRCLRWPYSSLHPFVDPQCSNSY